MKNTTMEHGQYEDLLQLSMYDELEPGQRQLLNDHLVSCAVCRTELMELQHLHTVLGHSAVVEVNDELLREARQELRSALRRERTGRTQWQRIRGWMSLPASGYRLVFGSGFAAVVGIVVGYVVFSPSLRQESTQPVAGNAAGTDGATRITNVRFVDADGSDGNIEFTFDAVAPVHVRGSVNDENVQKILTHAILNDQNPGTRLRSVNALAGREIKEPDRELKAALIGALKSDENPGVRTEALRVLQSFPFDDEIKDAFLHVLVHDKNSGLRIAAINSLDSARTVGRADQEVLNVMRESMRSDDNSYVRFRAKSVLQEVRNQ
jgi:hypothetical protein